MGNIYSTVIRYFYTQKGVLPEISDIVVYDERDESSPLDSFYQLMDQDNDYDNEDFGFLETSLRKSDPIDIPPRNNAR